MSNISLNELEEKFPALFEEWGRCLSVREVATFLGWTPETVRANYVILGGTILSGRYIFSERSFLNALQDEKWKMAESNPHRWQENANQSVQHKERGDRIRNGIKLKQLKAKDKHGLFG